MDLKQELHKVDEERLERKSCIVIGCRTFKQNLTSYCRKHQKMLAQGKIQGDIPLSVRDRFTMLTQLATDLKKDLACGFVSREKAHEDFFVKGMKILAEIPGVDFNSIAENLEHIANVSGFEAAREQYKEKLRSRRMAYVLKMMSLPNTVIDIKEKDAGINITLRLDYTCKKGDDYGIVDPSSLFIPGKDILGILEKMYKRGKSMILMAPRIPTLSQEDWHKSTGRRKKKDEVPTG